MTTSSVRLLCLRNDDEMMSESLKLWLWLQILSSSTLCDSKIRICRFVSPEMCFAVIIYSILNMMTVWLLWLCWLFISDASSVKWTIWAFLSLPEDKLQLCFSSNKQTPFTETQKHAAEREYISFPDAVVELELFLFGFCVKSWAQNFRFDEKNVCNYHLVTFLIKVI